MKDLEDGIDSAQRVVSGLTPCLVKLTVFFLVSILFLPLMIQNSDILHRFLASPGDFSFSFQPTGDSRLVENLIERIHAAVRQLEPAHGKDISFSADDRKAWEERNPCSSRVELKAHYERRKHVKDVAVNNRWAAVLEEYAVLHRVCMSKIGDPKKYFSAQNVSTGCKFLIVEAHYGLGNKLLHMSSLLVYAVLTQRVLLIPSSTYVPSILCEPFPGSSWSISNDLLHLVQSHRQTSDKLYEAMDLDRAGTEELATYASHSGTDWGPDIRFWCRTEQDLFSKVTWLTMDGCLYFLPKLFAIDTFRPVMEALFPDRVVLTHVLRSVMLPADPVWKRILQAKALFLDSAEKQVGVQVRYVLGERQYNSDHSFVNDQIMQCLWENDILPEVCPKSPPANAKFANCSAEGKPRTASRSAATKVLITSLYLSFHDHINDVYLAKETATGESIDVVQLTHERTQGFGVDVDSQALVEMIALSFSDVLLVTPFSTFGGIAQAYGALLPYFIQNKKAEAAGQHCERGLSVEPCYLGAIPNYDCRYDAPKQRPVVEIVPFLQKCPRIDVGNEPGMLLITKQPIRQS